MSLKGIFLAIKLIALWGSMHTRPKNVSKPCSSSHFFSTNRAFMPLWGGIRKRNLKHLKLFQMLESSGTALE
jgi:hypothetical protein